MNTQNQDSRSKYRPNSLAGYRGHLRHTVKSRIVLSQGPAIMRHVSWISKLILTKGCNDAWNYKANLLLCKNPIVWQ
jgi:hypothetical protein